MGDDPHLVDRTRLVLASASETEKSRRRAMNGHLVVVWLPPRSDPSCFDPPNGLLRGSRPQPERPDHSGRLECRSERATNAVVAMTDGRLALEVGGQTVSRPGSRS